MRTFIAIEIPPTVKTALAALQTELRRAAADVGWTTAENFHLTLRFLGEVEEARLGEIRRVCDETAATVSSFTLRLSGAGAFPNVRQPRVLWAGVAGEI
ncbi:MAG TPA: RNA 2',3'-cyclic phosphodiesterase, partial [Blastocatellia bacterium]|nr:RNA 2',3'-cyclic phosphodiesterase [Blastocatellia bacterium]